MGIIKIRLDKEVKNCWDFEKCSKEVRDNCPAYKYNSGKECWLIAGSINKNPHCQKIKDGIECWECEWYKKRNPNEI